MLGMTAIVSAAEVEAHLDRASVPAGNGALMTLKISGGRAGAPEIPEVENLIIQPRGQSQQMQMINGQTSVSVTYTYIVGSNTPGDYLIPAIEVIADGKKSSTEPLKLNVLASAAAQPAAGIPANPPVAQANTSENRFGFLTVELAGAGRKHAYVGEIAPVIIRAWLPEESRASLRSSIQPEGNGFTLHNVSQQPQQTREIRDGQRYLVVTWYGGISATKAGKLPASLSVDATVAIRDTSAPMPQRRRTGGPFGTFDDMFEDLNVPMIQKDVTLKSEDQEIEVRPLPTEGRPAGFTGAVGEFKFEGVRIPSHWKTGEPQQMAAKLGGSGNFALIKAPGLNPAESWKTYPGKEEFAAGDVASFAGSKTFEFSTVPRKGGEQNLSLTFSYFDPAVGTYKAITSPPQKIQVEGQDIVEVEPAAAPTSKEPEKKVASLVAQHLEMSSPSSLVPLVSKPAFLYVLDISGGLCGLGIVLAWLRSRREDPKRHALAALEKATLEALEVAGKCAAARDVSGWFAAARLALQQQLGALWNQPAQAITLAEITMRIPDDSPVAKFFQEADRYEYSRQSTDEILPQWRSLLDQAMSSLTPSIR